MSKKMALIATKGTLDMAYPPFILASTAASLGWEVQIFFTFYGLQLLRKDLGDIKISPLANPAMPMPVPMPVMVQMLPGMEAMATMMMKASGQLALMPLDTAVMIAALSLSRSSRLMPGLRGLPAVTITTSQPFRSA